MKFKINYAIYVIAIIIVGITTAGASGFTAVRIVGGELNVTTYSVNTTINTSIYQYNGTATENLNMNLYSILNATWTNGTNANYSQICLNGDCQSSWPSGPGGGGGANVSTTTCSGTQKVSAINNSTGIVTCSPDEDDDTAYNASYIPYVGATSNVDLGSKNISSLGYLGNTSNRVAKGWFTDLESTNAIVGNLIPLSSSSGTLIKNYNGDTVASFGLGGADSLNTAVMGALSIAGNATAPYYLGNFHGYVSNVTERNLFTDTYNSTYDAKPSNTYNATYDAKPSNTYNVTYDAKQNDIGSNCADNNYAYGVQNDGTLLCRADLQGGGSGVNYWQVGDGWMFPNITAGGDNDVNATNLNATGDINGTRLFDSGSRVLTSETDPEFSTWDKSTGISITENQISDLQSYLLSESDPLWSGNYSAFNTSWSSTYNSSYMTNTYNSTYDAKVSDNATWNESRANSLYCLLSEPLWSENYTTFNSSWSSTYNSSYMTNTYNSTYDAKVSDNTTWNETRANALYHILNQLNSLWTGSLGFANLTAIPSTCTNQFSRGLTTTSSNCQSVTNDYLSSGVFSSITGIGTQSQDLNMNSNDIVNVAWMNSTNVNTTTSYVTNMCFNQLCTSNITNNGTYSIWY